MYDVLAFHILRSCGKERLLLSGDVFSPRLPHRAVLPAMFSVFSLIWEASVKNSVFPSLLNKTLGQRAVFLSHRLRRATEEHLRIPILRGSVLHFSVSWRLYPLIELPVFENHLPAYKQMHFFLSYLLSAALNRSDLPGHLLPCKYFHIYL